MSSFRTRINSKLWIGVALSFYAFIAIGIAEGGLGVLIPDIQKTYNLTSASISQIFLSQVTGYIIAALASSILSSRIGLGRMLLLAATILTCALIAYALSPYWWLMVAAGSFFGLGTGLIDAGINSYIANEQRHADLMGWLHAFYGVGALLGPAVATTLLAVNMNWRGIYLVFATVVGGMVALMLWTVVYNYTPLTKRVKGTETDPTASLRVALTTPIVLLAAMFLFIYVGTEVGVGNWAYSVQSLSRGTPKLLAGYSVSGYWIGLTTGRVLTGRIVQRWGAVRTLDRSLLLLGIGLVAWWLLPNQLLSLPVIGFALAPMFPLTIWLMPQRISAATVPAAIGFMTSVASLGAAIVPSVVGTLAARFSLEIIPVLMLPLAVFLAVIHRWLVQHQQTNST